MSNPPGLPPQNDGDQPDETPDAAADQPTVAYPGTDAQPTEVYPPAPDAQPTQAYPPAFDAYGQPPAPSAPAAYPPPAYATATAPKPPDTRPKTFGWVSLALAVVGLVLVLVAFIPLLWVSLVLALVGGLLLLGGLVFGIITLANKNQGGKGLGIGAIVVSVLGGGAWIGAIIWAFLLIGLAASDSSPGTIDPSPTPSATAEVSEPPATDDEATDDTPSGTYDEEAYLAEVRPIVLVLFQEIQPSITEAELAAVLPDEALVGMGQAIVLGGEELGRDLIVTTLSQSGFSEEQATRFYDTILSAAQAHLVE